MDLTGMMQAAAGATPTGNPNAWDISKAYYDAGADAWDISKASYRIVNVLISTQETDPSGLFFKPDGTKMYICGTNGDDVNEYDLSTPWLVSSASYVQNFSVSAQDVTPQGVFFKPDGTKMYVVGSTNDKVYEYSLSSAWNISTASYVQDFSVSAQESIPNDLFFKPDGTKMYIAGATGDDINEYDLSTPWDISTASYLQNFSVSSQETVVAGLSFKPDGTKMYISGSSGAVAPEVNEYSLSSAWDISTASYVQTFAANQDTQPQALFFHPDGIGFYILGQTTDRVYQYNIGGFSVVAQEANPNALFFKPDGTKMYVLGGSGDDVNEYDLSTAWDVSSASYVQNFSVASQDTNPTGLFFKSDGTKMYVIGYNNDNVNEYDLSTPWDISTASYVQNFSVLAQEVTAYGLFFKPDGTKMYITGAENEVNEYSLSSAWDISTASYVQNFSVSAQINSARDLFFKPDGTKMYVTDNTGDDVNEYDLSTPWDISTASYVQNLASQDSTPEGLFWKDDGTQFWIIGPSTDRVYSYLISPT